MASKTTRAIVAAAALVAAVLVFAPRTVESESGQAWPDLSAQFDLRQLEAGDLVFRRGRDGVADAVMTYGEGSRYSHVGAIVIRDGAPRVVHAIPAESTLPGGVIEEDFAEFGAPAAASALGVYRIAGLTDAQKQAIQRNLEGQLGKPFDLRLMASDDREQYCTELVAGALRSAGLIHGDQVRTIESGLMPEPVIPPEALLELPRVKAVRATGG